MANDWTRTRVRPLDFDRVRFVKIGLRNKTNYSHRSLEREERDRLLVDTGEFL
jgi:hypothetical protein